MSEGKKYRPVIALRAHKEAHGVPLPDGIRTDWDLGGGKDESGQVNCPLKEAGCSGKLIVKSDGTYGCSNPLHFMYRN